MAGVVGDRARCTT